MRFRVPVGLPVQRGDGRLGVLTVPAIMVVGNTASGRQSRAHIHRLRKRPDAACGSLSVKLEAVFRLCIRSSVLSD